MKHSLRLWLAGCLVVAASAACAGSTPPSLSPDELSTIVAGTMAAITPPATNTALPTSASLLTPVVTTTSAPPTLRPTGPTVPLPSATRVTFQSGATMGVVHATIQAGGTQNYVLQAGQGQIMMVNVDSPNHDVTLSIKTQGGTSMLNASAGQSTWQQALPQTEDYYIAVHGGATQEEFTLTITIPSRIRFAEGATSAKVSGETAGGYNVLYAVFAIQDQKMSVELSNLSGDAALTIYGYTDGTPYVRYVSEQTSFSFKLPSTQDYIIEVVPRAGRVVSFLMTIKIQ